MSYVYVNSRIKATSEYILEGKKDTVRFPSVPAGGTLLAPQDSDTAQLWVFLEQQADDVAPSPQLGPGTHNPGCGLGVENSKLKM